MELKEQLKQELQNQKKEQLKQIKEANSKLISINLYEQRSKPAENIKKGLEEQGIKFKLFKLNEHPKIKSTVGMSSPVVIEVNGEYLVHGRDFSALAQLTRILPHVASPDYIPADPNARLLETMKNMAHAIHKNLSQIQGQLQPVLKVMADLSREVNEDIKEETQLKQNASKENK